MRRDRAHGQSSSELILVAAVLAVIGLALLGAIRLSGPRPAAAMAAGTVAQAPVGVALPLELGGLVGDGSTASVAIAARLLALGIRETGTNSGPWIATFTDGNAEPWCADFVSYVLRLAGRRSAAASPAAGGSRAPPASAPGSRRAALRHACDGAADARRHRLLPPQPRRHRRRGARRQPAHDRGQRVDAVRQRLYPSWRGSPISTVSGGPDVPRRTRPRDALHSGGVTPRGRPRSR